MHITPRELEKMLIFVAGDVARRRRERGLKLNHPEAVAYICAELMEGARDGRSVADLMSYGTEILTEDDVMDGVSSMMPSVQVEVTFPDGTKLISVEQPIRGGDGEATGPTPGEFILDDKPVIINEGLDTLTVHVENTGDRPIQVGSHYHFAEVNSYLKFDRDKTVGYRLDIPSGTAARFEPGDSREVNLVAFGGERKIFGFRDEINGYLDYPALRNADQ